MDGVNATARLRHEWNAGSSSAVTPRQPGASSPLARNPMPAPVPRSIPPRSGRSDSVKSKRRDREACEQRDVHDEEMRLQQQTDARHQREDGGHPGMFLARPCPPGREHHAAEHDRHPQRVGEARRVVHWQPGLKEVGRDFADSKIEGRLFQERQACRARDDPVVRSLEMRDDAGDVGSSCFQGSWPTSPGKT